MANDLTRVDLDKLCATQAMHWLHRYDASGKGGMSLLSWAWGLTHHSVFNEDILHLLGPVSLDERLAWMERHVALEGGRVTSYQALSENYRGSAPVLTAEQRNALRILVESEASSLERERAAPSLQLTNSSTAPLLLEDESNSDLELRLPHKNKMSISRKEAVENPIKQAVLYRIRESFLAPLAIGQLLGAQAATLEYNQLKYVFTGGTGTASMVNYLFNPFHFITGLFDLAQKIGGYDFSAENEATFTNIDGLCSAMYGAALRGPYSHFHENIVEQLRVGKISFKKGEDYDALEDNLALFFNGIHIGDVDNISNGRVIPNFASYSPWLCFLPNDWMHVASTPGSPFKLSEFMRRPSPQTKVSIRASPDDIPQSNIDIPSLVGFQNPQREKLDVIINSTMTHSNRESQIAAGNSTPYSQCWDFIISPRKRSDVSSLVSSDKEELYAFMKERLPKTILVDLGCGDLSRNSTMLRVAQQLGIPTYIGVDKYNVGYSGMEDVSQSVGDIARMINNYRKANPPEFTNLDVQAVRADMLDFASRLTSDIYGFSINGIDESILLNKGSSYSAALAVELFRASKPDSIVFGCNSQVFHYLEDAGFRFLEAPGIKTKDNNDGWIFEKSQ